MEKRNKRDLSEETKQALEQFVIDMVSQYGIQSVRSAAARYKREAIRNRRNL